MTARIARGCPPLRLLGEALNLMRNEMMNSVTPVGWPALSKIMLETIGHSRIEDCGTAREGKPFDRSTLGDRREDVACIFELSTGFIHLLSRDRAIVDGGICGVSNEYGPTASS